MDEIRSNITELAVEIVTAYVSNNSVPASELPALIVGVHGAIAATAGGAPAVAEAPAAEKPSPAQIRKSVSEDGIISFIDGKSYKTLKRHLTTNGLDPRSYRERFGLPLDYPMVAANYAAQRSALAKQIGLGRLGGMAPKETTRAVEAAADPKTDAKTEGKAKGGKTKGGRARPEAEATPAAPVRAAARSARRDTRKAA